MSSRCFSGSAISTRYTQVSNWKSTISVCVTTSRPVSVFLEWSDVLPTSGFDAQILNIRQSALSSRRASGAKGLLIHFIDVPISVWSCTEDGSYKTVNRYVLTYKTAEGDSFRRRYTTCRPCKVFTQNARCSGNATPVTWSTDLSLQSSVLCRCPNCSRCTAQFAKTGSSVAVYECYVRHGWRRFDLGR